METAVWTVRDPSNEILAVCPTMARANMVAAEIEADLDMETWIKEDWFLSDSDIGN